MIRVLVVDDSRILTKIVSRMLERDPVIQVIGTAQNGLEAIEKVQELKPDLVTLDIEMPVMNGIEALRHIMSTHPLPVIMLSTLTRDHADITMDALAMGACDFVTKDFSNSLLIDKQQELVNKIKDVAKNRARLLTSRFTIQDRPVLVTPRSSIKREIVAIGASTGGPPVLQYILSHLPKDFPVPVIVAQHMPRLFTQSFAERLDKLSMLTVREAEDKEGLQAGVVLIVPGDSHMVLLKRGKQTTVELIKDDKYIYRPSVDLLMSSTSVAYESRSTGLILTGMGSDGLVGMRELKSRGGYVIAQNEDTCVVYGMPKAVVNAQLADAVLPVERIPEEIVKAL